MGENETAFDMQSKEKVVRPIVCGEILLVFINLNALKACSPNAAGSALLCGMLNGIVV